jgi:hypothetical protein
MTSIALLVHGVAAVVGSHATAGWWTTDHVLALANVVVAATAVGTIIFGIRAIKSSDAMAASATKQAAASDAIAESARAQNLAGVRPLLVEVPKGILRTGEIDHEGPGKIIWQHAAGGTIVLIVPLRNVGPGTAFVDQVRIGSAEAHIDEPEITSRAIAPGNTASVVSVAPLSFDTAGSHGPLTQALFDGVVTVDVTYADVNSSQRTLTRLTVVATRDKKASLVRRVELYHCDDTWEPIEPPFVCTRLPAELRPQSAEPPIDSPPRVLTDEELATAIVAAHAEGMSFGKSVARDAPAPWLEAVLALKPRMPSNAEASMLQNSDLPIDTLQRDEVRQALRHGFFDALEYAPAAARRPAEPAPS